MRHAVSGLLPDLLFSCGGAAPAAGMGCCGSSAGLARGAAQFL